LPLRRIGVIAVSSSLLASSALAQQDPDLPPSARPGGTPTDQEERRREPKAPEGPVLEVPPLIERPLDPTKGERVQVKRFELKGAVDRPELGIDKAKIEQILADARRARESGFTIGQLEQVANRITEYYRGQGMILAKAVVPPQTVADGVVDIRVIEGRLGRIRPQGNELYSYAALSKAFAGLVDQPVNQQRTESALLTLTDYPGLAAFGVFKPGKASGEADLVLKVQDEDAFEGNLRLDNHGTENTGRGRARARLQWNNVTGGADRLRVTALGSFDPANTAFGKIGYKRILGRHYAVSGYASANEFQIGGDLEALDVEGETEKAGVRLTRQWIRSRRTNWSSDVSLDLKRSRTFVLGRQDNEDALTVLGLSTSYDGVDSRFNGLNYGRLELSQGLNDVLGSMGDSESAREQPLAERPSRSSQGEFAEGAFTKLFGYYSRVQNISASQSVLLRTEGQYSDDLLVPLEQYTIGGPNNVRAFPSSHAQLDSALLLSAEYVVDAPLLEGKVWGDTRWSELISVTVFYDYAIGELNKPGPFQPDEPVSFKGAGTSLRLSWPRTLKSRIQLAWPIHGNGQVADPEAVRSPQLWARLTYRF